MFSRSVRAFAAVTVIEFVVFALAAARVGVLLLILVVAALSASGAVLLFRLTTGLIRQSLEDLARSGSAATSQVGDRGLRVLGAVLLTFPGLVTGLFGALLLVPPVRAAVRPTIGSRLARLLPPDLAATSADLNRTIRRRDVVDVDSVRKDPGGSSPNPAAPKELR